MPPTGKRCAGCGEVKTFINFHRTKKINDGFKSRCKQCIKVETTARYERLRDRPVTVKEKRCLDCKRIKKAAEFHPHRLVKDGLNTRCKDCDGKNSTENRQHTAGLNAKWIMEQGGKCKNCGEDRLDALMQVAKDPRKKTRPLARATTEANRLRQLERVHVLCACCRRVQWYRALMQRMTETYPSLLMTPHSIRVRKRREDTVAYLRAMKRRIGKCSTCDRSCDTHDHATLASFDFDHLDRSTKIRHISAMACWARVKLDAELEKCRLLCANCHTIHSRDQVNHRQRTDALNSLQESTSKEEEPDIGPVDNDWTKLFCVPLDVM